MIHFLTGVPGGGKGVIAMHQIEKELVHGSRAILTDMAVRMVPWVRDVGVRSPWSKITKGEKFRPELGLLAYLEEKYGDTFSAAERIYLFDENEAKEFYLRRFDVKLKKWVLLDAERDSKGRIESFDTARQTAGALIVTDEFWSSYSSRDWQQTGMGMLFYAAQHRKFSDEWFIVCQNPKQIETQLRQIAHDTWEVRNHSKLALGPFRRPNRFTVAIFDKIPSGPSAKPMERRIFKLDKRGLGSCFDTSGGHGIGGGGSADLNEKKRGLPFWVLIVSVLCIIGLVSQVPRGFNWVASRFLVPKKVVRPVPPASSVVTAVNPLASLNAGIADMFKSERSVTNVVEVVKYGGYFWDGKRLKVLLSNGRNHVVRQEFRELADGVIVDGVKYPRKEVEYVPPDIPPVPVVDYIEPDRVVPQVSVTVIGRRPEIPRSVVGLDQRR